MTIDVFQFRVPGADEEGEQVPDGDGRAEHPRRAAVAGAAGGPARQDTEGARRVPRAREEQLPAVTPYTRLELTRDIAPS